MGQKSSAFTLSFLAGIVVLGLSLFGFSGLLTRPGMPKEALARDAGLEPAGVLAAVVRAEGYDIRNRDLDLKFIAARHRIGQPIEFVLVKDGRETALVEPLVPYYKKAGVPFVFLVTGLLGFLIGFAVLYLRAPDARARLVFWLCLAFSSSVMISGEWYGVQGRPLHLIPGVLFFFAYTLTPVILLRFALSFTARGRLPGGPALWAAALLLGAFYSGANAAGILVPSIATFRLIRFFWIFRLFFAVLCIAAAVVLFRAFRMAPSRAKRDQIRWVLYGMLVGLGPFTLLYTLPQIARFRPVLNEEAASAFFALLPLALGFAILRHKLLDINVIINRSVVYSVLTMVTVGVYLASIEGLKALFATGTGRGGRWIPLGAVFVAAMVFAPARSRIQVLIDKAFFRRAYDERRAIRRFTEGAEKAGTSEEALAVLAAALDEALPVERIGAYVPAPGSAGTGFRSGLDYDAVASLLLSGEGLPEAEVKRLGFETALSLPLGEGQPAGWIFLGPKRSGLRFTDEDRELLQTLAAEMAGSIRRIRLQEEVVYERATREKLEELGRMKTEFISSVSHELRTPMSSLQAISELLNSGKADETVRRKHLIGLMAGECGRLSRYLHNVLDFGRIEQNGMSYDLRPADLGPVVSGVVEVVRSASTEDDLDLECRVPPAPVMVEADPDAVRQALLNLIDNAIKYSRGRKHISVRLRAAEDGGAEIAVGDRGLGIPPEERERIFEAFYRSPEAVAHDPAGVGLGLMVVKHIMDAHGGAIGIASTVGRGSTFTLKFPARR
jgi:signal transduction histidine kinase